MLTPSCRTEAMTALLYQPLCGHAHLLLLSVVGVVHAQEDDGHEVGAAHHEQTSLKRVECRAVMLNIRGEAPRKINCWH